MKYLLIILISFQFIGCTTTYVKSDIECDFACACKGKKLYEINAQGCVCQSSK